MTTYANKDFNERMEKCHKERDVINERLKKKDYILTVYQRGDCMMSLGDHKRQVEPRRFFAICSLEEIPEYIKFMKQGFWTYKEEGLTKKEIKNYPHEKKKWGIYCNIIIEPLSEELEKSYLSASKKGFFEDWRIQREDEEVSV